VRYRPASRHSRLPQPRQRQSHDRPGLQPARSTAAVWHSGDDMSHMRSKSAAEMGRARRDVKNQFPARRGQLRDDPLQAPGGKPLIGERNGLGTKLCTHQVIMGTGHTGHVRQLRKEPIIG
jgi:hypothetical protein